MLHRTRPSGGSEQAMTESLASSRPVSLGGLPERGFSFSASYKPSSTYLWRVDATVLALTPRTPIISLSVLPIPRDMPCGLSSARSSILALVIVRALFVPVLANLSKLLRFLPFRNHDISSLTF